MLQKLLMGFVCTAFVIYSILEHGFKNFANFVLSPTLNHFLTGRELLQ
jgi:hypothetical protein